MNAVTFTLTPGLFSDREQVIACFKTLSATAFRYPTGVCALKLANDRGELVVLPFQGQQIWRAWFGGQDLTMKSTFPYPLPTTDYLATYGGFLLHCGATAMGVPTAQDSHPLHGELPNLAYDQAVLSFGEDENGPYIALGGNQEYRVAFGIHYRAEPKIRLYEGASTFQVQMCLTNMRRRPLAYMYLCHINFRPVDGAELVYSAPANPAHVFAHPSDPGGLPADEAGRLARYIESTNADPRVHHVVDPSRQAYDPEIVMTIRYLADADGYAHSLQQLPDGSAFYVSHRIAELPLGLRWIARTGDEDAMGLVLPATAEHKGLAYARQNGQLKWLQADKQVTLSMVVGWLDREKTAKVRTRIESIVAPR